VIFRNPMRKLAAALLVFIFVIGSAAVPAGAETTAQKTVKVAVYNNSLFAYQDDEGTWRGTDVECLTRIAQTAGFEVKFIDSSNDPDFLKGLSEGKYDIACNVAKTVDREKNFLYSDMALGTLSGTLAVREDDDRWDYGDIDQISKMKIGVIKSFSNNKGFRNWCSVRKLTPKIVEFDSIDGMTKALADGKIDGELYSFDYGESYTSKYRTILQLLPQSYYYAFRKDDTDLKNEVDEALTQIFIEDPNYLSNLNEKYSYQFKAKEEPLTAVEKKYLAAHPVLKVAVIRKDAPYHSISKGIDIGIIPDYYKYLAKYCGVKFKYVSYDTGDKAIKAVSDGKADILGIFSGGVIAASQKNLILSSYYGTISGVLLTKSSTSASEIKTIVVKGRAIGSVQGSIFSQLKGTTLKTCDSADECFKMVKDGDVDAALLGMPSATWLLNNNSSNAYSITQLAGLEFELCAGLKEDNILLRGILNKGIASTRLSFDSIVTRDTLAAGGWKNVLNQIPPYMIMFIALGLLAVVLILIWSLISLKRRSEERNALVEGRAEAERQRMEIEALHRNVEERNQFFSNISHDMRTPLNAIMGFIRLSNENDDDPELRHMYLEKAEAAGDLLLNLIDDTLTISRANSGKMELLVRPCRTYDIIRDVTVPISEIAKKKNVAFKVEDAGLSDLYVMADMLSVEKVFINLLSNAVKFTPEGGHVWYTVRELSKSDERVWYEVTVRDDGIGMSKDFMVHMFEPFSQEKRHGYDAMGTGLGLSIVKQIVDYSDGDIKVESEIGKGTTFVIRCGFDVVDHVAGDETEERVYSGKSFAGKKVLICEDNMFNREIAVAMLKSKGIETVTAADGKDGAAAFEGSEAGSFDAVLMDLHMPVMDGYEAAQAIRNLDRPDAATVPIIAMTADAFDEDVQKCLASGMDAHIAKPINPTVFFDTLGKFIG